MFASGGDSVPGGRRGPGRAPYRDGPQPAVIPSPEAAAVGVARRLQARLDRHLWLIRQIHPEPPQLRELTDTVRRMRRDAESVVLLNGGDPIGHTGDPRRLSEVLDDATAAAEETWRILVRPAAAATVEPERRRRAGVPAGRAARPPDRRLPGRRHRRGQLRDRAHRAHRRGVGEQREPLRPGRARARDGPRATAEAHAHRSRSGLSLTLPAGPPPTGGTGVVATVSCPAAAVTIEEPAWSSVVATDRQHLAALNPAGSNGNGWGNGHNAGSGGGSAFRPDRPPGVARRPGSTSCSGR